MQIAVNTFLNLLLLVGLYVLARMYVHYMLRTRHIDGTITLANGHEYAYQAGDDLVWYDWQGRLRGIDVQLSKEFPHMYLDSQKGGGRQVRFFIDPSQRLRLEGDFNTYFQAFTPKGYATNCLSILSPDVMWTLRQHAGEYDVEIYGSHLRIISRRRIFKHPDRLQTALVVAKSVLTELDQRLQTWSAADSQHARDEDLKLYPLRAIRIGKHYVRWQVIGFAVWWAVVMFGLLGVAAVLYFQQHDRAAAEAMAAMGIGLFVVFSGVTFWGVRKSSFRSRRG